MELMIDLETMGTSNDAAITAIGAVFFDKAGLHNEFYCTVDLADAAKYGRIDGSTVKWWLQQEADARREIYLSNTLLGTALGSFSYFAGDLKNVGVWGFGATFDNVILRNAFTATGLRCPWHFRNDRCFRTLAAINPHVIWDDRVGTHHNALDDAKTQALTAVKMLWPQS